MARTFAKIPYLLNGQQVSSFLECCKSRLQHQNMTLELKKNSDVCYFMDARSHESEAHIYFNIVYTSFRNKVLQRRESICRYFRNVATV